MLPIETHVPLDAAPNHSVHGAECSAEQRRAEQRGAGFMFHSRAHSSRELVVQTTDGRSALQSGSSDKHVGVLWSSGGAGRGGRPLPIESLFLFSRPAIAARSEDVSGSRAAASQPPASRQPDARHTHRHPALRRGGAWRSGARISAHLSADYVLSRAECSALCASEYLAKRAAACR